MVFCSIVLKVKRIHKIVISSCSAAYKITNWSWHRCCATVSRWVTAFPFSRSVSLKTKFSSILSALTSHQKGLPLKWFRNSWFLASVRFSIQRQFAPRCRCLAGLRGETGCGASGTLWPSGCVTPEYCPHSSFHLHHPLFPKRINVLVNTLLSGKEYYSLALCTFPGLLLLCNRATQLNGWGPLSDRNCISTSDLRKNGPGVFHRSERIQLNLVSAVQATCLLRNAKVQKVRQKQIQVSVYF